MTSAEFRLSTPRWPAPRALDATELATVHAIADVLIPRAGDEPAATEDPEFDDWLARALAARADAFESVVKVLASLAHGGSRLHDRLRGLEKEDFASFQALSAVVAGAWLMSPNTRERIGYPGQRAVSFPVDRGANEVSDGILDPVLERGEFFRPTPG